MTGGNGGRCAFAPENAEGREDRSRLPASRKRGRPHFEGLEAGFARRVASFRGKLLAGGSAALFRWPALFFPKARADALIWLPRNSHDEWCVEISSRISVLPDWNRYHAAAGPPCRGSNRRGS